MIKEYPIKIKVEKVEKATPCVVEPEVEVLTKLLEEFLIKFAKNKLLYDREPTEEEWQELLEKLRSKKLILD